MLVSLWLVASDASTRLHADAHLCQGETFEYVNLTKKYRYVSEQVSHHPVRPAHCRFDLRIRI